MTAAAPKTKWLSYEESSSWAVENKITSVAQWRLVTKPENIPQNPDQLYPKFYTTGGWGKFLNTKRTSTRNRKYLSYSETQQWAQENNILTREDWLSAELPENIPRTLHLYPEYLQNGGWSGFSGAKTLSNTSIIERLIRLTLDQAFDLNAHPHRQQKITLLNKTYQIDMLYLNKKLIIEYDGYYFHKDKSKIDQEKNSNLKSAGFQVIRLREAGLTTIDETFDLFFSKKDSSQIKIKKTINHILNLSENNLLPLENTTIEKLKELLNPTNYENILQKLKQFQSFYSYEEASLWAKNNDINSSSEWRKKEKPNYIPSSPPEYYLDFKERGGWGGFLQTQAIANKNKVFVTYKEAQQWAQENNIKKSKEWPKNRPNNIPSSPDKHYLEFTTWSDFLNTPKPLNRNREWATYDEARQWGNDNGVKNSVDWKKITKPLHIPSEPQVIYKDFYEKGGWASFLDKSNSISVKATRIRLR